MASGTDRAKRAAALAAIAEVEDGMLVGLGTGSTVAFALEGLAARCRQGLRIDAVATSLRTAAAAEALGIAIRDFSTIAAVDLCIDGVDEIDPQFRAIKGGGGAMLREKVVAQAAARMIAIADGGKLVHRLGKAPVPVEVTPFALAFVADRVAGLGGRPVTRHLVDGSPYATDQGNAVLDCQFDMIDDPAALAEALAAIAGVAGHGLFVSEIDALYVGRGDEAERRER